MPISEEQRRRRMGRIGSSDVAPLFGIGRRNAYDVYLSKIYEMEQGKESEAIDLGNRFEEPLIQWAADRLGVAGSVALNVEVLPEGDFRGANLDGLIVPGKEQGLEAKWRGGGEQGWGEELSDQVPEDVLLQTAHQMLVADLSVVWIPALVVDYRVAQPKLYRAEKDGKLLELVRDREQEFWESHVVPRIPPPNLTPSIETVKRIVRHQGEIVTLPDEVAEMVLAYRKLGEEAGAIEGAQEIVQTQILLALGDAELGDYGDPEKILTYKKQGRTDPDRKVLQARYPEVWAEVAKKTEFRVMRFSKR